MKKSSSIAEIQSMLREGHFGVSRNLPLADPITVTQMMLPIDRIKPYDRNPRREFNPRYAEIKASIRAQGGLNNPLTITRRPADELYMIESGGNTRLQILNELYIETGDERFFRIHCVLRPWVSESHILTSHLIENELRGEMLLIDKALGLLDLKSQVEQELGKSLSRSEFVRQLGRIGYTISRRLIIRFEYAATVLYPLIPMALRAGMGGTQIERIRKLEIAYRAFWKSRAGADDAPPFDEVFGASLAAHDDFEFDLDVLRQDLERRICIALNVSIQLLRLEAGALERTGNYPDDLSEDGLVDTPDPGPAGSTIFSFLSPAEPDLSPPGPAADPPVVDMSSQWKTEKPLPDQDTSTTTQPGKRAAASNPPDDTSSGDSLSLASSPESASLPKEPDLHSDLESTLSASYSGPTDIKSLRSRNYGLALQIATRNGLEPCIVPSPRLGMGFLVDLPEVPFDDLQIEDLNRRWIWWLLLSLSEALVQLERLEHIEGKYRLRDLFLNDQVDPDECFQLFGEPTWPALGYQFLNDPGVDERDFRDLMLLAANCRRLRKRANDDGELTLWSKE